FDQAFVTRNEVSDDYGQSSSRRSYQRNTRGRYYPRRHHLFPPAVYCGRKDPRLSCTRRGSSGCDTVVRFHRCIRHKGNGQILSSCVDREKLSSSWGCFFWSSREGAL